MKLLINTKDYMREAMQNYLVNENKMNLTKEIIHDVAEAIAFSKVIGEYDVGISIGEGTHWC